MTDEEKAVEELARIVKEMRNNGYDDFSTNYELWTIAAKIQENMIRHRANNLYANAHLVWERTSPPSALEKIGMELQNFNETIGMELSKFNENNNNI